MDPDDKTDTSAQPTVTLGSLATMHAGGDAPEPTPVDAGRYVDLGPLGEGGMGEVRRVQDRVLGRTVAMKMVHHESQHRVGARARFLAEAGATARLQHPGIVPVYDLGALDDGRPFFTMQEIRGRTLAAAIADVHGSGAPGWTIRRLVDVLLRACEAMAYAHDHGVVHRDLKPANVMIGDNGEVLVVDWGLAWRLAAQKEARRGIEGTPAYMAPEQARGALNEVDARTDVYALGAVLYEILVGRRAHGGDSPTDVLQEVLRGPAPRAVGRNVPEDLADACHKAMSTRREDRFPDARALAEEIRACLDGARRREQARALVVRAVGHAGEVERQRRMAIEARSVADAALSGVPTWASEEEKAAGWALQDEADDLATRAERVDLEVERELNAALQLDPTCPEAHAALATRLLAQHAAAEAARDHHAALHAESALREHADALPEEHPVRARAAAWLDGDTDLALATDPPGVEAVLFRYERVRRRLVAVRVRSLGTTPLTVALPRGSYVIELEGVRYPVEIGRGGVAESVTIRMLASLGPDDVYVPAGVYRAGGDPSAPNCEAAARRHVDGFVLRRFPVTLREYIVFLDALVADGREAEALRHAPRERPGAAGELGALILGRTDAGFCLRADADGDAWSLDWPAIGVDWFGANAYAGWEAARTGQPWRLPTEHEWEKAARGVDGRPFPWGDHLDPAWCCMRGSHPGRPLPASVLAFPADESPYGVRGLGGNVRDWCSDTVDGGITRVDRGGSWFDVPANIRSANRRMNIPELRGSYLGFRLARSFP